MAIGSTSLWRFDRALAFLLVSLALGCGNEEESCDFEPCGGDLEGKWYAESACPADDLQRVGDAISGRLGCASKVTVVEFHSSGTLILDSYGDYRRTRTLMLTWQLIWSRDCMSALAGRAVSEAEMALECSSYGEYLVQNGGLDFSSGVCSSASPGTCTCELGQIDSLNESGTYENYGTTLAFDNGNELGVCRRGTELKVRDGTAAFGPIVETFAPM